MTTHHAQPTRPEVAGAPAPEARAHAAAGAAAGRAARREAPARPERLDLRADRAATTRRSAPTAAALRARHLPEPARGHHRRADDGRLRVGRHAGELPPLELRQGVHRHREELPARPDGPGLRDRHQLRPLHQLPDGGEHDGDAGARHRPRGLRPQQLLQGQLPVPHVDRRVVDHRLPGLRARTTSPSARRGTACDAVEDLLDSCHALHELRRRPLPPAEQDLARRGAARGARSARPTRRRRSTTSGARCRKRAEQARAKPTRRKRFPSEPQENILYFIEKNAPLLEPWQREVVRIVRKIAQYFYPQRQTQVMNEGWATFWHHQLLNTLYDEGHLTDGVMIEWLKSHTNVIFQPPVGHRAYSGINPYALGFAMYTDIQRICENPTDEDRDWFPNLAGNAVAAGAAPRDAQLQGRELHRPVPVAEGDPRLAPVRDPRRRAPGAPARLGDPRRRSGYRRRARGAVAPVRPRHRASPTSRSGASTCAATAR